MTASLVIIYNLCIFTIDLHFSTIFESRELKRVATSLDLSGIVPYCRVDNDSGKIAHLRITQCGSSVYAFLVIKRYTIVLIESKCVVDISVGWIHAHHKM